jgi:glyoxylase-like metal-dependent hydrolase (beta-lactamase superfamily II)
MQLCELQPGLFMLPAASGGQNLALYLIVGERRLLVDSGLAVQAAQQIVPALQQSGRGAPDLLLNSHCDADHHGGNAALLAAFPRLLVMAHAADAGRIASVERHLNDRYIAATAADDTPYGDDVLDWLRAEIGADSPVHIALQGGETLDLGAGQRWQVLHVPGHTDGHLALWHAGRRTLIVQDAVMGRAVPDAAGRPVSPPPYFDVAAYRASLLRLCALGAATLFTAHYPALHDAAAVDAFFAESLAFIDDVDALVGALFTQSDTVLSLAQVCAAIDAQLGPYDMALQWVPPVRAHLNQLVADGRLTVVGERPRRWRRCS